MAFNIEKLFDRNNVAMREEVVCVEVKMCPCDAIKGADTSGQFDALSFKWVKECFRSFGAFWPGYGAQRHGSCYECSYLWRQL